MQIELKDIYNWAIKNRGLEMMYLRSHILSVIYPGLFVYLKYHSELLRRIYLLIIFYISNFPKYNTYTQVELNGGVSNPSLDGPLAHPHKY